MEKTFFLAEREPLVEKNDFFASFKTGFYLHVTLGLRDTPLAVKATHSSNLLPFQKNTFFI